MEIEGDAMAWLEWHGERACGLARQHVHEAWRLGGHEEADRWQAVRAHIAGCDPCGTSAGLVFKCVKNDFRATDPSR